MDVISFVESFIQNEKLDYIGMKRHFQEESLTRTFLEKAFQESVDSAPDEAKRFRGPLMNLELPW